jgi:dephospho-CoA kinase
VLDADRFAHEALAPGSKGESAVLKRYGARVTAPCDGAIKELKSNSRINRKALGSIVFNAPDELRWLEQLIHPYVRERFDEALVGLNDEPTVVLMIPLLFEANLTGLCSEVWVVHCQPQQQIERIQKRDGLDESAAKARIDAQWPIGQKQELADQLIDNSGDAGRWEGQIQHLLDAPISLRTTHGQGNNL